MAEEEKGREIGNIFVSFFSSSFYGLFTGRCFRGFFICFFFFALFLASIVLEFAFE